MWLNMFTFQKQTLTMIDRRVVSIKTASIKSCSKDYLKSFFLKHEEITGFFPMVCPLVLCYFAMKDNLHDLCKHSPDLLIFTNQVFQKILNLLLGNCHFRILESSSLCNLVHRSSRTQKHHGYPIFLRQCFSMSAILYCWHSQKKNQTDRH